MTQTRLGSLLESLMNIFIGLLISIGANLIVLPAFGYPVSPGDAIGIGLVFTLISLIRSYLIRRWFNSLRRFYAAHPIK